jgi:hypothetical protein
VLLTLTKGLGNFVDIFDSVIKCWHIVTPPRQSNSELVKGRRGGGKGKGERGEGEEGGKGGRGGTPEFPFFKKLL